METSKVSMLAFALAIAATAANAASTGTTTSTKSTTTQTTAPAHTQSAAPAKTAAPATSTAPAAEDHLAAIKANLQHSRHSLRGYHWKETIVVNYKGEDKATMVNSCVYDANGKVVRTREPVPATASSGGMHAATTSSKNAEIKSYEHSAVALMRSYVPLDPVKLDKCRKSGKMSTEVIQDGQRVKLSFKDYQKPGDMLMVEINPGTNQVLGFSVDSYLASAKDAVKLDVDVASLPDGTSYPAKVKLDTPAKELGLTATNSDYQKKTS